MGYPIFVPPIHHSVLFNYEKCQAKKQRSVQGLQHPPQYGIATKDYQKGYTNLLWPYLTEYQAKFCSTTKPDLPDPRPAEKRCPLSAPDPVVTQLRHHVLCQGQSKPSPFQLYEKTPLPLLDKKLRGCHYQVYDPVGTQTLEERTKCRIGGVNGPEAISWRAESEDTFTPTYRYLEWVNRPVTEMLQELESNVLKCRLPPVDTKHYDFYHQVRMRRPTPSLTDKPFETCSAIPIPLDV